MRFKRCAMVPNSHHLADFDDDTLAKTWLHDVNTTPMKFSERTPNHLSGCPFPSLRSLFELDLLKK
jgi:hypothetical protein